MTKTSMSGSIRVIIADDEPLVRAELRAMLAAHAGVEVIAEYRDGCEALEGIAATHPDVALLDIRMPGLTGLEVAEHVARHQWDNAPPMIVFVTAYDRYAVQAFEADAVDYIVKPVDENRLRRTIERVQQRHQRGERAAAIDQLHDTIARLRASITSEPTPYRQRLVVQAAGALRVISLDLVEWIEADDNYARLHTPSGVQLLRETLRSLERALDPAMFMRVHRSAIVRIDRVKEVRPQPNGDHQLRLASGARVVMSRSYRDAVLKVLTGKSESV